MEQKRFRGDFKGKRDELSKELEDFRAQKTKELDTKRASTIEYGGS